MATAALCRISFTVGLNDRSEYDGGGTHFECLDRVLHADCGQFTAFPGSLVHAGAPTTRGTRYILVLFVYAEGWNSCGPTTGDRDDPLAFEWLRGEGAGSLDQPLPPL